MKSLVHNYSQGFFSPLEARRILKKNPELKKWVYIPMLIDFIILLSSFGTSMYYIPILVESAIGYLPFAIDGGFLYYLVLVPITILLWAVFIVFCLYVTFILSTIVSSPFNSILAEKYLVLSGTVALQERGFKGEVGFFIKMFFTSLRKALLFTFLGIIIFVCSFIPFVNIAATFSVFLIMSFDCMDYSFEVMGLSLRQRIQFVRQNGVSYFGHGSFLAVTSLIPGLTILLLPYGVLGAAELIARAKNEYPTA